MLRLSTAMLANKLAGSSDLPNHHERLFVDVVLDLADYRPMSSMRMIVHIYPSLPSRL